MYAKVIVDVPAKPTNRPFDYIVPDSMREWVEIGSRVGVPFGPRVVQGFVVEIFESSVMDQSKLKPIGQILDLYPPLTKELVQLARWMSGKYVCHEITALQSMIPSALKAKYERILSLSDHPEHPALFLPEEMEIIEFIRSKQEVSMESLLKAFPLCGAVVKQLIQRGVLMEMQSIKDRFSKKKALTVFPPDDLSALQNGINQLPSNARRQREVLEFLLRNPQPIRLSDLIVELELSAGTVKSLAEKKWIELREVEVFRDPYESRMFSASAPLKLTEEQHHVFRQIDRSLTAKNHEVFLLHGVTGSGKTEVYLQSIQKCLDLGWEAIVLVPEISLTPQMVERFKSRFGDRVAVLHSRLSHGERYDEWRKIQQQKVKVVIGARSAVFAPFTKVGLIILDEEHESSYKQEDSPKYHARDVAIQRGIYHRAPVILGSATPSLESYFQTRENFPFRLLRMDSRVEGRPLPPVHVIDMREELKEGNRSMFSRRLYKAIEDRLQKKEQIVLLLNRRGYSTFVMCRSCGYVAGCPHCDISLTYHQRSQTVRCHYCGYAEPERQICPDCGSEHIRYFGTGTQRVEEQLGKLFPGIRVIRMDVDTTTEKGSHEKWLAMFRNREADVLLGTQMVAKGLDFPDVTLVGVIAADTVLNLPDFRAAEKTFQLMTQVAGRAGRHQLPGEVFIQTYTPEHYSIAAASRHDYSGFVDLELTQRSQRNYPPYCHLVLVVFSHEQVPLLVRAGESFAGYVKELWQSFRKGIQADGADSPSLYMDVFGPVASPIPRIKDRYRFQCMVKYRGDIPVAEMVMKAMSQLEETVKKDKLQISVDVDPQVLM